MSREIVLVALLFGLVAAGIAYAMVVGQKGYDAYLAENPPAQAADSETSDRSILSFELGEGERLSDLQYWGIPLALITFCAYVWMLVIAFGEGPAWGFLVLLGNGAGGLVFVLFHPEKALATALLMYGSGGGLLLLALYGT